MDTKLAFITGSKLLIPECKLILYQPSIAEIGMIGETDFYAGIQLICIDKMTYFEGESGLENINNFQIFMTAIIDPRLKDKRESVEKVFSLILPDYTYAFLPRSILFSKDGETFVLDDNNFQYFQEAVSAMFCVSTSIGNPGFNPKGKKAKQIAEKLAKARKKVAEQGGDSLSSALVTYASALSIGLGIPVTEISKYTLFQLYDSLERYGLYTAWDVDLRSRLAGGKPDRQPENWMKNLH